jgi:hypothetical protein
MVNVCECLQRRQRATDLRGLIGRRSFPLCEGMWSGYKSLTCLYGTVEPPAYGAHLSHPEGQLCGTWEPSTVTLWAGELQGTLRTGWIGEPKEANALL